MLQSTVRIIDRQGTVPEPSLETRLRLWRNARLPQRLEAAKPKPKSAQPDLFDERQWRRNSRRVNAQQIMGRISRQHTASVARALGVTPRAVRYWRAGAVAPTTQHWRQLQALYVMLLAVATKWHALSNS
jgi:signal recognition particle subunit SEC65